MESSEGSLASSTKGDKKKKEKKAKEEVRQVTRLSQRAASRQQHQCDDACAQCCNTVDGPPSQANVSPLAARHQFSRPTQSTNIQVDTF